MKTAEAGAVVKGHGSRHLSGEQGRNGRQEQCRGILLKGYVMALLLSMTTMIYGLNVARSIIQEKTSRIFEVMLAIVKPSDMLAGKLIGVGAVGTDPNPHLARRRSSDCRIHAACAASCPASRRFISPGPKAYSFRFTLFLATCSTVRSLRASPPPAKPNRNCRCTCRSPPLPIWLSFSLICAHHQ